MKLAPEMKVKAVQLTRETLDYILVLTDLTPANVITETDPVDGTEYLGLNVQTRNGRRRLSEGSYLLRDEDGNHSVISRMLFEDTYINSKEN